VILYNPLDFYPCSLLFRRELSRKSTIATDEKHAYFASLISLSRQRKKEPSQGGEKKAQRFSKNVGDFFENDGHFLTTLGDLCHSTLFFEEIMPQNLVNHRKHYKFATQR
jgi:hypothetical protein